MIRMRDVAHVRDGSAPQQNVVHVDGQRSVLMTVLKSGATSTIAIVNGIKAMIPQVKVGLPQAAHHHAAERSIGVRQGRGERRAARRSDRRGADQPDDSAVPGLVAFHPDRRHLDPALRARRGGGAVGVRRNPERDDAWRPWRSRSASWSTKAP